MFVGRSFSQQIYHQALNPLAARGIELLHVRSKHVPRVCFGPQWLGLLLEEGGPPAGIAQAGVLGFKFGDPRQSFGQLIFEVISSGFGVKAWQVSQR